MTAPFAPTPFATPVVNPSIGGYGQPVPYISASQYRFAPTAMDTENLVEGQPEASQIQALSDTIRRASGAMDRFCFGADPAPKGASLCATQSIESVRTSIKNGRLSLVCDYKPVLEVDGMALGTGPQDVANISSALVSFIQIEGKVVSIPAQYLSVNIGGLTDTAPFLSLGASSSIYAVWSYVNGYPHTSLVAAVTKGATSLTLKATSPTGGLYGVYTGTQLTIKDGNRTETVQVTAVTGNVVTTTATEFAHDLPAAPDFIPVSTLPADIEQAAIFLTTALIKSRGDNAMVLDSFGSPTRMVGAPGDLDEDVKTAQDYLAPFRLTSLGKMKR